MEIGGKLCVRYRFVRLLITRQYAALVDECPDHSEFDADRVIDVLARILVEVGGTRLLDLLSVPPGKVTTYSALGKLWNTHPRSVANLLRRNPFPVIIPCHRVVDSRGFLRGYMFGLDLKKRLLEAEGVSIKSDLRVDLRKYFVYPSRVEANFNEVLKYLKKSLGVGDV